MNLVWDLLHFYFVLLIEWNLSKLREENPCKNSSPYNTMRSITKIKSKNLHRNESVL